MPIEFRCSQCNQLLRVPETAAGKSARCPKCQALMTVPSESVPGAALDSLSSDPLPSAPAPAPAAVNPLADTTAFTPAAAAAAPAAAPLAESPFGSPAASPQKPAGNPFGDEGGGGSPFGGPATLGDNPYASPASAAYAYEPKPGEGIPRTGLPWEIKTKGLGTWWETSKLILMQPSYAYSIMFRAGGLGGPMAFCAIGLVAGFVGQLLWYLPLIIAMTVMTNQGENMAVMLATQIGMQIVSSVMGVVLGATLGLLIGAAIAHVCLMILGSARYGFETTFRVLAYANGATSWLNVIPGAGGLVAAIWLLVAEVIGLSKAHDITIGKALLAVFLPIIACIGLLVLGGIMIGVFAAMQS